MIENEVWEAIKKVDAKYADLTADIGIDATLPVPAKSAKQSRGQDA